MYIKVASPDTASNLSNVMKDGNWIVLYYANWCGHCNTMKPEWQKVINRIKKNNSNTNNTTINIADIESSHMDHLTNKPTIAGFPTIKMYNSGNEIANFEDERIADKIHTFAILNSKKTHSHKTKKSKSKHKSHKTKKSYKSHKSHKTKKSYKLHTINHRPTPKMINLNMKNNLRMPTNISKLIGLNH